MIRSTVILLSLSLCLPSIALAAKGGRWADDSSSQPGKRHKDKTVEVDTLAPVINAPSQIIAEASSSAGTTISYSVNAKDNVDGPIAVTCTPSSGSLFPIASTSVRCESTDTAGNQAVASFMVSVNDNTAPTLSLPANIVAESSSGNALPVNYNVSATDSVDGAVAASCAPASGASFAPGQTTVQCNASDSAGNTASNAFLVTVNVQAVDSIAPQITVPSKLIVEAQNSAGATVNYSVAASDDVDGALSATCSPLSNTVFPQGNSSVYCEATDTAGNKATASFIVAVNDNTAPTLSLPANIVAESSSGSALPVNFSVSAIDTVDGTVTPNCAPASGASFAPGETTVQCNASDSAGNTASNAFLVTVNVLIVDNTAPQITVPSNLLVEAQSSAGATVNYSVAANDDIDGVLSAACLPLSNTIFPQGTSTVHCEATDTAGNKATASFSVAVMDSQPPIINTPENVIADSIDGNALAVNYTVSANDMIDGSITHSCAPASGTLFNVGETSIACEAADSAGNTALSTFLVTVNDTTPAPEPTLNFSVNVGWQIPTIRTDGSPLTVSDLAEYAIVYDSDPSLSNIKTLNVPSLDANGQPVSEFAIPDLPAGTYYFAIAAVDTDGMASNFSELVTVNLQ